MPSNILQFSLSLQETAGLVKHGTLVLAYGRLCQQTQIDRVEFDIPSACRREDDMQYTLLRAEAGSFFSSASDMFS